MGEALDEQSSSPPEAVKSLMATNRGRSERIGRRVISGAPWRPPSNCEGRQTANPYHQVVNGQGRSLELRSETPSKRTLEPRKCPRF